MSFEALRREYEELRIGAQLLDRVRMIVTRTARRYPPAVYAETSGVWDAAALEALVQDFVTSSMLMGGQLDYTMSVATTLPDFDRLTIAQLRRHLRESRRRTVVDNLVDRARKLLPDQSSAPVLASGAAARAAAVRRATLVPREVSDVRERAPRVYSEEDLGRVLEAITAELGRQPTLDEVRAVLSTVLTELVPSELLSLQDDRADDERSGPGVGDAASRRAGRDAGGELMAVPELVPEQIVLAEDLAHRIFVEMEELDVTVLRMKWGGASDALVADSVGLSRPTVATRKQRLLQRLQEEMEELDEPTQKRALDELARRLVEGGGHG